MNLDKMPTREAPGLACRDRRSKRRHAPFARNNFARSPQAESAFDPFGRTKVRHLANKIEDVKKVLLGYRDNMRVEIGSDVPVSAKTVADLRALPSGQDGLVLDIHVDLDPRLSVVRVERAS